MSDESSAQIREARKDWVTEHREKYLQSGGVEGHIEDLTPVGGHDFGTHLLLKYRGRKSGKVFVASKGGADTHPGWYLNLKAQDGVEFQIASQAFRGTMREPEGAEREKLWAFMVDCYPFYASYQTSTSRVIPLVLMKAKEAIPVFRESDATGIRSF